MGTFKQTSRAQQRPQLVCSSAVNSGFIGLQRIRHVLLRPKNVKTTNAKLSAFGFKYQRSQSQSRSCNSSTTPRCTSASTRFSTFDHRSSLPVISDCLQPVSVHCVWILEGKCDGTTSVDLLRRKSTLIHPPILCPNLCLNLVEQKTKEPEHGQLYPSL